MKTFKQLVNEFKVPQVVKQGLNYATVMDDELLAFVTRSQELKAQAKAVTAEAKKKAEAKKREEAEAKRRQSIGGSRGSARAFSDVRDYDPYDNYGGGGEGGE